MEQCCRHGRESRCQYISCYNGIFLIKIGFLIQKTFPASVSGHVLECGLRRCSMPSGRMRIPDKDDTSVFMFFSFFRFGILVFQRLHPAFLLYTVSERRDFKGRETPSFMSYSVFMVFVEHISVHAQKNH